MFILLLMTFHYPEHVFFLVMYKYLLFDLIIVVLILNIYTTKDDLRKHEESEKCCGG